MSILNIMVCMFQEICKKFVEEYNHGGFGIVIPRSEILKWFTHQSGGDTVNAKVTHQNENKWIGIVVCVVPKPFPNFDGILTCSIRCNEHCLGGFCLDYFPRSFEVESNHLWMTYIPLQVFSEKERAILGQIDENGFIQMELKFELDGQEINKCGFRLVYEQDMEDIREMLSAQSSNNTCITPYEGLDVHHNSTEGIKLKLSRDEYEGAGSSGEGSSNDVPHSKRIER